MVQYRMMKLAKPASIAQNSVRIYADLGMNTNSPTE